MPLLKPAFSDKLFACSAKAIAFTGDSFKLSLLCCSKLFIRTVSAFFCADELVDFCEYNYKNRNLKNIYGLFGSLLKLYEKVLSR
jgi:hypothetical protein